MYHARVFKFVLTRMNNDYYDAQEITSDVFIKVSEFLEVFDPERAKFSTWLFTITRNKIIDKQRSDSVKRKNDDAYFANVSCDDYIQNDRIEKKELGLKIERSFSILNINERAVADLYLNQDKQYKEIAEMLNINIGGVKVILHRARAKMQEYLKEYAV